MGWSVLLNSVILFMKLDALDIVTCMLRVVLSFLLNVYFIRMKHFLFSSDSFNQGLLVLLVVPPKKSISLVYLLKDPGLIFVALCIFFVAISLIFVLIFIISCYWVCLAWVCSCFSKFFNWIIWSFICTFSEF